MLNGIGLLIHKKKKYISCQALIRKKLVYFGGLNNFWAYNPFNILLF